MEEDDKKGIIQDFSNCLTQSENDIYIGGTCALLYALDFEDYMKGQEIGDYISLFFIAHSAGRDKKELAVFGKEHIENVASLPLQYYHCVEPKVTISAIRTYLSNWNETLKVNEDNVKLFLNIPENALEQLTFSNLKVYNPSSVDFTFKSINNIVQCFKYHYRKLQIIKHIVLGQESKNMVFLDYLTMIGAAWHHVSSTIHSGLHNEKSFINLPKQSLTDWCRNFNVPLCFPSSRPLDDFVYYDNALQSIKLKDELGDQEAIETEFSEVNSNSEIEAYQAMKRLLSYLQGEGVDPAIINSAKLLEDHLESDAVTKIDEMFASNNIPYTG